MIVQVRMYAATNIDERYLEIGAGARLVLATGDRQPVLATGSRTSAMRWASSSNAEALANQLDVAPPREVVKWQEQRFAVPRGVSGSVTFADQENHRELRVVVSNPPGKTAWRNVNCADLSGEASQREQVVLQSLPVTDPMERRAGDSVSVQRFRGEVCRRGRAGQTNAAAVG